MLFNSNKSDLKFYEKRFNWIILLFLIGSLKIFNADVAKQNPRLTSTWNYSWGSFRVLWKFLVFLLLQLLWLFKLFYLRIFVTLLNKMAFWIFKVIIVNLVHLFIIIQLCILRIIEVSFFKISFFDSLNDFIRNLLLSLAGVWIWKHFLTDDLIVIIFFVKVNF